MLLRGLSAGFMQTLNTQGTRGIRSIAIPPLGSHNGGLDWLRVKQMIEAALADLDCDVYLYEPSDVIIEKMTSERVKLTPARAMLLLMFGEMNREGEFASVFAAEKLVYFMQRFGAKNLFKIEYKPYFYGPYSGGKVAHVLYYMNGSYIKGMGGMDNRPFDYIWLTDGAEKEAVDYIAAYKDGSLSEICDKTKSFLRGYYSNYSLELLATVDYLRENVSELADWRQKDESEVLDVLASEIQNWSRRKEQMFPPSLLSSAVKYLRAAL